MNNDLISREALKTELEAYRHTRNYKSDEEEAQNALLDNVLEDIDNAPTVGKKKFEQVLPPIKVNLPEDINDKLIEEMSKPQKIICDEPEALQDYCFIAYSNGFEAARRLFEQPQDEWIIKNDVYCICPRCNYTDVKFSNYCPDCGMKLLKGGAE